MERAAAVRQILVSLADGTRCLGAAVAARDGVPAVDVMTRPASAESFCAMAAAALGAAEGAIQEWADERPESATVDAGKLRLLVRALDARYILVLMAALPGPSAMEVDLAVSRLKAILAAP